MTAIWTGVVGHPLFVLGLTLLAFQLALELYQRSRWLLAQPVLVATLLLVGGTVTVALTLGIAALLGANQEMLMTLAPKSVTSPIAIALAEEMGGIPALTAVFVMITGVLGAVIGPFLLDRARVTSPAARGLTLGLSAHAIGTAQALQENHEAGGFAALAMSLAGAATAILLPMLVCT
ncbi:LrgB family protein [Geopseudomonas aromaticivorans]